MDYSTQNTTRMKRDHYIWYQSSSILGTTLEPTIHQIHGLFQNHCSLNKHGRVLLKNVAAESGIEIGGHKVFDEMSNRIFERTVLVTVGNTVYPITKSVLHQVFDRFGKIEMVYILPVKDDFQALLRFEYNWNASLALSELQGRNIYDECCRLDIQFISRNFLDKCESYCDLCCDSFTAIELRSIFIGLMSESLCIHGQTIKDKSTLVSCVEGEQATVSTKEKVVVFDELSVCEEVSMKNISTTSRLSPFRGIVFPVFDGNQPRKWIRDCEEYFQLLSTSEKYKITLAMTYMRGRTKLWRKCYEENMGETTWSDFVTAVIKEFEDCNAECVFPEVVMSELTHETTKETEVKFETQVCNSMIEPAVVSKAPEFVEEIREYVEPHMFDKGLEKECKMIRLELGREFMKRVLIASLMMDQKGSSMGNHDVPFIKKMSIVAGHYIVSHDDYSGPNSHLFDPGGTDVLKASLSVHSNMDFVGDIEFLRAKTFIFKSDFERDDLYRYLLDFEKYMLICILLRRKFERMFRGIMFSLREILLEQCYDDAKYLACGDICILRALIFDLGGVSFIISELIFTCYLNCGRFVEFLRATEHTLEEFYVDLRVGWKVLTCYFENMRDGKCLVHKRRVLMMSEKLMHGMYVGGKCLIRVCYRKRKLWQIRSLRARIIPEMGQLHFSNTIVWSRNGDYVKFLHCGSVEIDTGHLSEVTENYVVFGCVLISPINLDELNTTSFEYRRNYSNNNKESSSTLLSLAEKKRSRNLKGLKQAQLTWMISILSYVKEYEKLDNFLYLKMRGFTETSLEEIMNCGPCSETTLLQEDLMLKKKVSPYLSCYVNCGVDILDHIFCCMNSSLLVQNGWLKCIANIIRNICWSWEIGDGKVSSQVRCLKSHGICLCRMNCHMYNDWRFLHKLLSFEEKLESVFNRSVIALRICVISHYSFCGFIKGVTDCFGENWKCDEVFGWILVSPFIQDEAKDCKNSGITPLISKLGKCVRYCFDPDGLVFMVKLDFNGILIILRDQHKGLETSLVVCYDEFLGASFKITVYCFAISFATCMSSLKLYHHLINLQLRRSAIFDADDGSFKYVFLYELEALLNACFAMESLWRKVNHVVHVLDDSAPYDIRRAIYYRLKIDFKLGSVCSSSSSRINQERNDKLGYWYGLGSWRNEKELSISRGIAWVNEEAMNADFLINNPRGRGSIQRRGIVMTQLAILKRQERDCVVAE